MKRIRLHAQVVMAAALGIGAAPGVPRLKAAVERVATLGEARAAHTATPLRSGRVLIAGGMVQGGGALASAEIFDPVTNRVRAIRPMTAPRLDHTATPLADGRVLIVGGYDGAYLASAELFDPETQQFTRTGSLSEGRSGHTATRLRDGRVLVVGGVGHGWSFLASAELYDPETERFEPAGSMAVPRESHTATLLDDGRVLVVGGHRGRRAAMEVYASAEAYDPSRGAFVPAGSLATPRHKHDAIAFEGGRVLVIGGADRTDRRHYQTTEIYDPARGAFAAGPAMASRRYKIRGTAVALPDGAVLVGAGARTVEVLDPARLRFRSATGEIGEGYAFATATALPGGDVVIVGGYDEENRNTAGVWRFYAARARDSR